MVKEHVRAVPTRKAAPAPSDKSGSEASTAAGTSSTPSPTKTDASGAASPEKTSEGKGAQGEKKPPESASASAAPADKPPEPKKPPLSRGWAELMDREDKLRAETEANKPLSAAREKAKTSVFDAIVMAFGEDAFDRAQTEYLERQRGTRTPEQIAEAAARKAIEDERKRAKDAEDAAARERDEKAKTEANARLKRTTDGLVAAGNALPAADMEAIRLFGAQPIHTIAFWAERHNGEWPEDFTAAIREHEAHLRKQLEGSGYSKAPTAPEKTGAAAPPAQAQTAPTITADDVGSVPVRRHVPNGQSAMERALAIVREAYPSSN